MSYLKQLFFAGEHNNEESDEAIQPGDLFPSTPNSHGNDKETNGFWRPWCTKPSVVSKISHEISNEEAGIPYEAPILGQLVDLSSPIKMNQSRTEKRLQRAKTRLGTFSHNIHSLISSGIRLSRPVQPAEKISVTEKGEIGSNVTNSAAANPSAVNPTSTPLPSTSRSKKIHPAVAIKKKGKKYSFHGSKNLENLQLLKISQRSWHCWKPRLKIYRNTYVFRVRIK